ncbi:hypothetical protein [Chryseobacterium sp. AG844]|uniref:hypothetical protein n=1 Tax=Chryseobacterium sp. AG844 TaxID=2183998 RepID=UPI000D715BF6|nr:hypothetical protein [Chryseobacterium sp. AG844]PWW30922.1 hypothetical protein DEU40_101349 [Chryseobacterium sp. AG844]
MDKIITEQIQASFKDNNELMIGLLIIYTLITIIIQFISNYCLSKKIETFKNDLKRSEIKFSKHSQMQIECLKNMYNNVVDWHFSFYELLNPKYLTHASLKSNINNLNIIFKSNMDYFHRNKILLTEEIIKQIGVVHSKFKKIQELCNKELDTLSSIEEYYMSNEPQTIYNEPENETSEIKKRIEELKTNYEVSSFEDDLKKLRELVENYFKELTN